MSSLLQVMKSLCVLIQHGVVTHQRKGKKSTVYQIDMDSVLLRVQFPRWVHVAKVLFGDAGEIIVEDILQHGHAHMTQVRIS